MWSVPCNFSSRIRSACLVRPPPLPRPGRTHAYSRTTRVHSPLACLLPGTARSLSPASSSLSTVGCPGVEHAARVLGQHLACASPLTPHITFIPSPHRPGMFVKPINYTLTFVNILLFLSSGWHLGRKLKVTFSGKTA